MHQCRFRFEIRNQMVAAGFSSQRGDIELGAPKNPGALKDGNQNDYEMDQSANEKVRSIKFPDPSFKTRSRKRIPPSLVGQEKETHSLQRIISDWALVAFYTPVGCSVLW